MTAPLDSALHAPAIAAPKHQPGLLYRILVGAGILSGLALVLYLTFSGELFRPAREALAAGDWQSTLLRPSLLWVTMGVLMLTLRTLLWFCYRPYPAASYDNAPMLSVVIPAYNEGAMVEQSIESVANVAVPLSRRVRLTAWLKALKSSVSMPAPPS